MKIQIDVNGGPAMVCAPHLADSHCSAMECFFFFHYLEKARARAHARARARFICSSDTQVCVLHVLLERANGQRQMCATDSNWMHLCVRNARGPSSHKTTFTARIFIRLVCVCVCVVPSFCHRQRGMTVQMAWTTRSWKFKNRIRSNAGQQSMRIGRKKKSNFQHLIEFNRNQIIFRSNWTGLCRRRCEWFCWMECNVHARSGQLYQWTVCFSVIYAPFVFYYLFICSRFGAAYLAHSASASTL